MIKIAIMKILYPQLLGVRFLGLLLGFGMLCQPAQATPFELKPLTPNALMKLFSEFEAVALGEEISNGRFAVSVYDQGVVKINFTTVTPLVVPVTQISGTGTKSIEQVYLKIAGTAYTRTRGSGRKTLGTTYPVSGTYFKAANKRKLNLFLSIADAKGRLRYYKLTITTDLKGQVVSTRVARAPQVALSGMTCANAVGSNQAIVSNAAGIATSGMVAELIQGGVLAEDKAQLSPQIAATSVYNLEMALENDHTFYALHGDNSGAEMVSVINAVEAIYNAQFGMSITVVSTNIRTTPGPYPASMTDEETVLQTFRASSVQAASYQTTDANHLFLGRDLTDGVVGIAYVSTICNDPSYSYGLTQYINSALTPLITAHELGHSFSAQHTTSGIMKASLSGAETNQFSSFSVSEIDSHIGQYGNLCLLSDSVPGSDQMSLRVAIRNGRFRAVISNFIPEEGCYLALRAADSQIGAIDGEVIFAVDPSQSQISANAGLRRTVKNSNSRVYFVAQRYCTSGDGSYSAVKSLRPGSASSISSEKRVSVSRWISYLRRLFS